MERNIWKECAHSNSCEKNILMTCFDVFAKWIENQHFWIFFPLVQERNSWKRERIDGRKKTWKILRGIFLFRYHCFWLLNSRIFHCCPHGEMALGITFYFFFLSIPLSLCCIFSLHTFICRPSFVIFKHPTECYGEKVLYSFFFSCGLEICHRPVSLLRSSSSHNTSASLYGFAPSTRRVYA